MKKKYSQKEINALLKLAKGIKAGDQIEATDKMISDLGKISFPLFREPCTGKMFFAWRGCSYVFKDRINEMLDSLRME
ncbi:hypothetical protein ASswx1_92 [Aeromonas phage Asswx_1]|uniref:Uncharacterized protein n=1 Tax=Aeromonas phage Asswx_1 TaxID=2419739 RepID=A0A411B842_9CAUD|nr:hypothetical protein ASswx1_92 [Aeromonas phage Asswx_1]